MFDGKVTAICRGDTVIFEPHSASKLKVLEISLMAAQAGLLYVTAEEKRMIGYPLEEKKLLNKYYEKITNTKEKLAFLQEAKNIYHTKCDLNGNFSISNIPKGAYHIYAFI